jgi:hypothetical protein
MGRFWEKREIYNGMVIRQGALSRRPDAILKLVKPNNVAGGTLEVAPSPVWGGATLFRIFSRHLHCCACNGVQHYLDPPSGAEVQ